MKTETLILIILLKGRNGRTAIAMNGIKQKLPKIVSALILVSTLAAGGYALWRAGAFLPRWIPWADADFWDESGEYRSQRHLESVSLSSAGQVN